MRALGVDPGTRSLGWGVVERDGSRLCHIAHGVVRVDPALPLARRLVVLADALEAVLAEHRPTLGAVEGIFFDKNAASAAKLGHARGVVLLCLERAGVEPQEHAPALVKRTLTGNGRAEKAQVARVVQALLGLPTPAPADASDALALAITELRRDPRARLLEQAVKKSRARRLPPGVAAALEQARARRRTPP
jgi:crossover junction endodeoxyribonuclease RuvC